MNRYEIERLAADSAFAAIAERRQAESDVMSHVGLAFDGADAKEIYRNALEHCGVSRDDTQYLTTASLKVLLKHRPTPGSREWRNAPAMAFDTGEKSVLDDILAGTAA